MEDSVIQCRIATSRAIQARLRRVMHEILGVQSRLRALGEGGMSNEDGSSESGPMDSAQGASQGRTAGRNA